MEPGSSAPDGADFDNISTNYQEAEEDIMQATTRGIRVRRGGRGTAGRGRVGRGRVFLRGSEGNGGGTQQGVEHPGVEGGNCWLGGWVSKALRKATDGWVKDREELMELKMEREITTEILDDRACYYVHAVVERLNLEMDGLGTVIPTGRCGMVVLLMRCLLQQQLEWLNILSRKRRTREGNITKGELYCFFGLMFFPHLTNL